MLVLSLREGRGVVLLNRDTGEEIGRIVLVENRGNNSRLGFELPEEIQILREEIAPPIVSAFVDQFSGPQLSAA